MAYTTGGSLRSRIFESRHPRSFPLTAFCQWPTGVLFTIDGRLPGPRNPTAIISDCSANTTLSSSHPVSVFWKSGAGSAISWRRLPRHEGLASISVLPWLRLARQRHPELEFQIADAGGVSLEEKFDYIILSDLVNDLPDVQAVLEKLRAVATPRTRLVVNFFNNLWRPVLHGAERGWFQIPHAAAKLAVDERRGQFAAPGWLGDHQT